jgi:parallel beta-helix repeat protein
MFRRQYPAIMSRVSRSRRDNAFFRAKVFWAVSIFLIVVGMSSVCPAQSGLIGYWALNEGAGNTASDSSGYGNTGTLVNGPAWTTGKVGGALSFDGINDQVNIRNIAAINNAGAVTLSAWIRRKAANAIVSLGQQDSASALLGIEAWSDGRIYLEVGNGSFSYGTFPLNDPNWHHVVLVFDGSQAGNANRLKGYLDGVKQTLAFSGSIPATIATMRTAFTIGSAGTDGSVTNGFIDEVRLYNRALSDVEVNSVYQNTFGSSTQVAAPSTSPSGVQTQSPIIVQTPQAGSPSASTSKPTQLASPSTTPTLATVSSLPQSQSGGLYFVATNGNDSNPGTEGAPFKTMKKGVSMLKPGDTLYVKDGSYVGSSQLADIPSGTSWNEPVTIAAYPGHKPMITAEANDIALYFDYRQQYVVVDGFIIDATGGTDGVKITWVSDPSNAAHHIRIQNTEIKNGATAGVIVTGEFAQYNEFINLKVHNNGRDRQDHGIYIATSNNLIEGCDVYNHLGHGLHIYSGASYKPSYNTIRGNFVHDNVGGGISVFYGINNSVYNNISFNNNTGVLIVSNGSTVYNNTVYNNSGAGILVDASNVTVSNNIAYGNPSDGLYVGEWGNSVTVTNNLLSNNSGNFKDDARGTALAGNLIGDNYEPNFANISAFDFRLQVGSSAIDAGITLPEVSTDIFGTARPRGLRYDIGAYEH